MKHKTKKTSSHTMPHHLTSTLMSMIGISIAIIMAMIDTGITNTALPTMAGEFIVSDSVIIWAVTSYLLAMVALTMPFASLGEVYGYRKIFLIGYVVFTIASLLCGLSQSFEFLIFSRALQGIGAAALLSTNLSLIRFIFPPEKLGMGLGINGLCMGVGFSLGPTIASIILWFTSWHWLFFINVPIGLIGGIIAWRHLPVTPLAQYRFDLFAALFCAVTFSAFVMGVGELAHISSWRTVLFAFALSCISFIALTLREKGHKAPFMAVDLFRFPAFSISVAAILFVFIAQGIAFVTLPFLFQNILNRSVAEIGFIIAPWPACAACSSIFVGRLSDRIKPTLLVCIGMFLVACGLSLISTLPKATPNIVIIILMMISGCGMGFFNAPNQRIVISATPRERTGAANGMMNMARLLGQSTGAALVAFFLSLSSLQGPYFALWTGIGAILIALLLNVLQLVRKT